MSNALEVLPIEVSVVVPVYGGAQTLVELHQRLSSELTRLGKSFEIIFVDDCGASENLEFLKRIRLADNRVVVVEMIRNVGQIAATAHGISKSRGRLIVTIDDDLQQWPEDIGKMIHEIEENELDLVVARFPKRKHSLIRNLASELMRRIAVRTLPVDRSTHFSSFLVMKREVFDNYFGTGPISLVQTGWMYHTAPRHCEVEVRHSERAFGKSSYSLRSLWRVARPLFDAVIEGSLQLVVFVSFVQIVVALFGGLYLAVQYVQGDIKSPGFTSIVFLLLAILGVLGVAVGLLAQFLRSIKKLIINKPTTLIRTVHKAEN